MRSIELRWWLWKKTKKLLWWKWLWFYDFDEKYVKIKFNSDGKLPLNKTIEISTMKIAVRADFH